MRYLERETELMYFLSFSIDCKHLIIGFMDFYCQVLDIQEGFKLKYTLEDEAQIQHLSMSFSNNRKYYSQGSKIINAKQIWDSSNNFNLVHKMKGHEGFLNSVCFSSDCRYLVTGYLDKTFKLWNAKKDFEHIYKRSLYHLYINIMLFQKRQQILTQMLQMQHL